MARDPGRRGFSKIAAVAWREFRYTALTKAFIFGAVGVPIFLMTMGVLAPLFTKGSTTVVQGRVAVIDPSGRVAPILERLFEKEAVESGGRGGAAVATSPRDMEGGPLELTVEPVDDPAKAESLLASLGRDGLVAIMRIPPAALEAPEPGTPRAEIELLLPNATPWHVTSRLERMARNATVEARLGGLGIDAGRMRALMQPPEVVSQRVGRDGDLRREVALSRMFLPIGFMMLLWMCVVTSGQYLLTTTIEEKSSRVMEVLLSAVSPMQLLTGKLLGQALVSAVMLGMYMGSAVMALSIFAMADLIQPIQYLWLVLYFVMAYFMVATMMVAVGSAVSDLREAQALITPVTLILVIPLILWLPISNAPNGLLATITSFIPPAIPFVMILRLASSSEPVPTWQIATSLLVGAASVVAMLAAAARIFRVGILMQGKPPTPRELLRWMLVR